MKRIVIQSRTLIAIFAVLLFLGWAVYNIISGQSPIIHYCFIGFFIIIESIALIIENYSKNE